MARRFQRTLEWLALLLALLVAVWAGPARAELRTSIEPRIIDELDTARLTIRSTGSNDTQRLDLEALEADFEVLTTQSASQYRSVNGRVESWVEYQIMLRPRRAGELTVPPIEVGGELTEPVTLRVRGIEPELKDAIDRMVFFETELTENPVYVQSQTVLVRRLYYSSGAQIYSDLPGMPEIPNAIVMPLGETTSDATIRDGRRYGVIEQRFAIFPEQSGTLTIPAISITSSVRVSTGDRTRRAGVRIGTERMDLEVLPIPPEYPADQPWLPAADLSLGDRWSPVDARLEVGDPLSRTLTARVEGNVSSAIPPLDPALPDDRFRSYPEPPELENASAAGSILGVREQTYAIIPTAPGTVELPPIEVTWWDVEKRQVRTARSPGRIMRITGAPVPAGAAPGKAADGPTPAQPAMPPDAGADLDVDVRRDQVPWPGPERRRTAWLLLSGMVAAVAVFSLLRRWQPWHGRAAGRPLSRRRCWRLLKQTCQRGDPREVQQALHAYLRAHYRVPLADALRRFRGAGHGGVLDALNGELYRPAAAGGIAGDAVLAAVRDIRHPRHRRADPLPALYD